MDDVAPAGTGLMPDFNLFGWPYTGFVTLFALGVYFWFTFRVGLMRKKCKVQAPDTDGPPEFRRAYRVQQNTLEHLIVFLPLIWIAALASRDEWTAVVGVFWPIGRLIYSFGYMRDPNKRAPGFFISAASSVVLFVLCCVQLVRSLLEWQ
jgi:glutathione S-transferase